MKVVNSTRSSVEKSSQLTIDNRASSIISNIPLEHHDDEDVEEFSNLQFKTEEIECLNHLRAFCLEKNLQVSKQTIYRFAIFHGFNVTRASRAIAKKHDHPYLNSRLEEELAEFIKTKRVIFPLPGLKSAIGSDVFYMHPSRYPPSASSNRLLVENMCYVLNNINQSVDQCRNGVVMIVNMEGYSMKNWHSETQVRLTQILEGHVIPASIVQILLVNPPPFFTKVWEVVWRTLPTWSSKKIYLINERNQLGNYLMEGYEDYLPDDLVGMRRNALELVERWLLDRKTFEESSTP